MHYLNKKKYAIFLMILPAAIFYLIYVISPLFVSFGYSLTNSKGLGPFNFVGLKNYFDLLRDKYFLLSLKNTFIILGVVLFIMLPGSIFMALVLNKEFRGSEIIKTLNFIPVVIAPIIVGLIWSFILDPENGVINMFLKRIGLESFALQWIGGVKLSPFSIAVVNVWEYIGLMMVIILAGLKLIPDEIYQAASIDGANKRQQLFHITLPMIKESIIISTILIVAGCFKIYETIIVLTNGGPNNSSQVLATYMYSKTFTSWQYGYGASISVIIFLLTMIFSIYFIFVTQRKDRKR